MITTRVLESGAGSRNGNVQTASHERENWQNTTNQQDFDCI